MITLSQLIYNLKDSYTGGRPTDDFTFSNRQLEFIINHFRAEIAAQRANQNKSVSGFYSHLKQVELEESEDFDPTDPDVIVYKSKHELPSTATNHKGGDMFGWVGLRDDDFGFQRTDVSMYNIDLEHSFVRNLYMEVDGYLYILTKVSYDINDLYVKMVAGDPREAYNFGKDEVELGNDWSYPIPANLVSQLNNLCINNEFRWRSMLKLDTVNDGNDETAQQ